MSGAVEAFVDGLFSLFGARSQSKATKEAAAIQAATADKLLAEQKRIFDLQRADRQPYVDASLGALGQAQNLAAQSHYMPLPAQRLGASSEPAPAMTLGTLGQSASAAPMTPPPSPPQTSRPMMGVFRAPDGETRSFPLSMEAQLIAKGAKRVQ